MSGEKIKAVQGELAKMQEDGYMIWPDGDIPRSKEEAKQILYRLGYTAGNPTYIAEAILDKNVSEAMRGEQHILLVGEESSMGESFAIAYQVWPQVNIADDLLVRRTLVGGLHQDREFMFKSAEIVE